MKKSNGIKMLLGSLCLSCLFNVNAYALNYTVQNGDSLYKIGQKYNLSYTTIINDNKISSTLIYPGQKLYIRDTIYTVKKGDSLYKISKLFGTTIQNLKSLNNLKGDIIYPGQTFKIKTTPTKTSTTSNTTNNKTQSNASSKYSQSEIDLLARLIYAEAGDQPYNAKVAVGAVVLNRVKSSQFPNSIKQVIYQKDYGYYQFTPVLNGYINKPASSEAKKASLDALNGTDPTKGALYFFDNTITNKWLLSKKRALQSGKMIFAY